MIDLDTLRHVDTDAARAARERYRAGAVEPTSGVAPGFTQANMIVLPRDWAFDFLLYAQRNPKACPVPTFPIPARMRPCLPRVRTCVVMCRSIGSGVTASLPKR